MKVLLVDVDSKIPNLALMKLSAWHKARGDKVRLVRLVHHRPSEVNLRGFWADKIYISCIFSRNTDFVRHMESTLKFYGKSVEIGGYGVNGAKLPDEIEHIMPDYGLYECDFSMGYTSWGCIRRCPWCKAWRMEGGIRDHAPIMEFLHPDHNKVLLLDNNFKASPRWRENLEYIIAHDLKVNFCQGLDIRLVDDEFAGMLADTKCYSIRFSERRICFAFDDPRIELEVRQGVERLKKAGIRAKRQMFYFLCGFREPYNFSEDWYRFKVLLELGVDPYVMKYNGRRDIRILNHFSRWVIKRDYKRKRPKYLRPHEWQELQGAISSLEGAA